MNYFLVCTLITWCLCTCLPRMLLVFFSLYFFYIRTPSQSVTSVEFTYNIVMVQRFVLTICLSIIIDMFNWGCLSCASFYRTSIVIFFLYFILLTKIIDHLLLKKNPTRVGSVSNGVLLVESQSKFDPCCQWSLVWWVISVNSSVDLGRKGLGYALTLGVWVAFPSRKLFSPKNKK